MIPILFKANATKFNTYGIGVLKDCTKCEVTEERNGAFECVLKYPVNGPLYPEIAVERLIKAKPNDTANDQMFRIYRISTPINGEITIYAQHLSYDLSNIAALPWDSGSITAALAMEQLLQNTATSHNFTCLTDSSSSTNFHVEKPQSVRACLGGVSGSFLDCWGGEFEWDNYLVRHHKARGQKTGVVIEYGKNMTDMEHDCEISKAYTDLMPYAISTEPDGTERMITLAEVLLAITDTQLMQPKTLIKDFTDHFEMDATITEEQLREVATAYLENNSLGEILPTLTVKFEPLWKQPDYAAVLERVSLCDTVIIRHSKLGISSRAKVITTVYDTLAEKYVSVTLGAAQANLLNDVAETQVNTAQLASQVNKFPSMMNAAIAGATDLITGQSGGYVVINKSTENGQPYEMLILDAPKIEDAVNVWRWNMGGLGFSKNGYNGPYETAITQDGQIVANFITSGSLIANIIKAGVLQSPDGETFVLDLDNGTFSMNATGKFSSPDGNACIEINSQEIVLYVRDTQGRLLDKTRIGSMRGSDQIDYPYLLMGNLDSGDVGLMKKFKNGMWYGNSVPKDATGDFSGMTGASGVFINTNENKAYVVAGTEMQNIYTGEAIARFA